MTYATDKDDNDEDGLELLEAMERDTEEQVTAGMKRGRSDDQKGLDEEAEARVRSKRYIHMWDQC